MANAPPVSAPSLLDQYLASNAAKTQQSISQNTGAAIPVASQGAPPDPSTLGPAQDPPEVDEDGNPIVSVTAARRPPPPSATPATPPQLDPPPVQQSPNPVGLDYNNSAQVAAIHQALTAERNNGQPQQPPAKGGGLYGILPAGLQHGSLRSLLGGISDVLSVAGGGQQNYLASQQRQQLGNAAVGYDPNDEKASQAAIQRVIASGLPGATELAQQMQEHFQQAKIANATLQYNENYKNALIGARGQTNIDRAAPAVTGAADKATTLAQYKVAYAQAEARAQSIGPNFHASDFNLVPPEQWTEGLHQGLTANQEQVTSDKAAGRVQTQTNATIGANARLGAAGVSAGAHVRGAQIEAGKPTEGTIVQSLINKQNNGQPLTTAEQAYFNHATQVTKGRTASGRPALIGVSPQQQGASGFHPTHSLNGVPIAFNGQHWVDQSGKVYR